MAPHWLKNYFPWYSELLRFWLDPMSPILSPRGTRDSLSLSIFTGTLSSPSDMHAAAAAAAAKSLQSCPTLCDPRDGSPPGSTIPGILQARTLEWVAIPFSNAWKWKVKVKSLSRAWLPGTPWTAAHQAPPSMGFSRQGSWSGVPLPFPDMHAANLYLNHIISLEFNFNPIPLCKTPNHNQAQQSSHKLSKRHFPINSGQ